SSDISKLSQKQFNLVKEFVIKGEKSKVIKFLDKSRSSLRREIRSINNRLKNLKVVKTSNRLKNDLIIRRRQLTNRLKFVNDSLEKVKRKVSRVPRKIKEVKSFAKGDLIIRSNKVLDKIDNLSKKLNSIKLPTTGIRTG